MLDRKKHHGFTIIEVLVVAGIMAILIVIGGGISSTFALRRSVDDIANKITSELNLVKLQAARDGVQYRSTLNYLVVDGNARFVSLESKRGDSNRTSSFNVLDPISTKSYQIMSDYLMDQEEYIIDFNPNGTAVQAQNIVLRPVDEESTVSKCATIQVTQFGIIRTLIGRWDFDADVCNPIYDKQEVPAAGDDDDDAT